MKSPIPHPNTIHLFQTFYISTCVIIKSTSPLVQNKTNQNAITPYGKTYTLYTDTHTHTHIPGPAFHLFWYRVVGPSKKRSPEDEESHRNTRWRLEGSRPVEVGEAMAGRARMIRMFPNHYKIHPWNLTWNLKITQLKRKIIFQTSIFRFHVKFQGSNHTQMDGTSIAEDLKISINISWLLNFFHLLPFFFLLSLSQFSAMSDNTIKNSSLRNKIYVWIMYDIYVITCLTGV